METQDIKLQGQNRGASELTQADLSPSTINLNLDDFEDYVALYTKCDIIAHGSSTIDKNMSLKKCRFCD